MCTAPPRPPKIVTKGPSKSEVRAQERQLASYQEQIRVQQESAAAQLQAQIEAAAAETRRREEEMAALQQQQQQQQQAMAQQQTAQQAAAFTVTTAAAPADMTGTETTVATTPKRKRTDSLKVGAPAVATDAGTGLNVGV
jgi:hypothetical protein